MKKARFSLKETDLYEGEEPYFYSAETFDWAKTLENNWEIIKDEMADIIAGKTEITLSSPNPPYLSNPQGWKNIYFFNFMWQYHANCKRFPKTYALLKSIPNLTLAEFTVLEPHSRVLPHVGETNAVIRGHLGIVVPAPHPVCGIQVGTEQRGWEQGKVVLFSDCHRHTVWNDSNGRRFVMVFDITKPEYAGQIYWVNAQCLSALTLKYFTAKFPWFDKTPDAVLKIVHQFISVVWRLYLPVQRKMTWLG